MVGRRLIVMDSVKRVPALRNLIQTQRQFNGLLHRFHWMLIISSRVIGTGYTIYVNGAVERLSHLIDSVVVVKSHLKILRPNLDRATKV